MFGGAPVGASLSRTMVSVMMDVKSLLPLTVNCMAYVFGLKGIFKAIESTPKAALSAVLATAVFGSVFQPKKMDWVGWITGIAVASVGASMGFLIGCAAWGGRILMEGGRKKKD